MIAISISNGTGDAQGSERGLEYDTMSGRYAEFVEKEVLPLVELQAHVKLTKVPEGRATMGGSSGGSCALIMAWYHPEWYHRAWVCGVRSEEVMRGADKGICSAAAVRCTGSSRQPKSVHIGRMGKGVIT